MGSLKEEASIIGMLVLITQVNLAKAKSRDVASGEAIGICRIATLMKVIISMTRNMDKVFSHGPLEIFTKVTMLRTRDMETARCSGQMDRCMRASG
jgi:hypothetical protein